MRSREVDDLWRQGYDASFYYHENRRIREVVDSLRRGYNGVSFDFFAQYLTTNAPIADPYMCMADFSSYVDIKGRIDSDYEDKEKWNAMSLRNVAASGFFAADRAIKEYADRIWNLEQIKIKK